MKKRILAVFLLLVLLTGIASGCKKKETVAAEPPAPSMEIQRPEPEPEPESEPGPANPLTGLEVEEDISDLRPYAIMLNNISVALPQYGVSEADIIFEVLAEGGITRMLGVFQDLDGVGNIGSIRSARPYYIDLAQGYDAIYIHAGGSPQAYTDLSNKGIDHFDGVNGNTPSMFFRDQGRIKSAGYEHSMFTGSDLIEQVVANRESLRLTHPDGYTYEQEFDDDNPITGEDAPLIRAFFTSSKKTSFEYHEDEGVYKVYEYGAPYTDGANGEHVGVKNVLCLYTDVHQIAGDDKGRMTVRTTGEGDGLYACEGKAVKIHWSRPSLTDQFSYTLENGEPLKMHTGHNYVCILPMDAKITLTEE